MRFLTVFCGFTVQFSQISRMHPVTNFSSSMYIADNPWHGEFFRSCSFSSQSSKNGIFFCNFKCSLSIYTQDLKIFPLLIILPFLLQIIESINKCDVDIRRELFSTILVTFILIWCSICSMPFLFLSLRVLGHI